MPATPLSSTWFAQARARVGALPSRPGLDCRVQFGSDDATWHIEIVDGSIVRWDLGTIDEPQITLRMPHAVAIGIHRPGADGTAALAACALVGPDGTESRPSPMDVLDQPRLADLVEVPGADLTMQVRAFDGPFGDVDYWWRFESGRSAASEFGTVADPEIAVWGPFSVLHRVRTGQITLLDAIYEGAGVRGEEGPLMLFAGIQESPEFQDAIRSCGPSAGVLSTLGIVRAEPVFQGALADLAGDD